MIFRLHKVTLLPGDLTLTCRVFCEGLAGDASGWFLEGVCGGSGGRAGAGVVTCHVG